MIFKFELYKVGTQTEATTKSISMKDQASALELCLQVRTRAKIGWKQTLICREFTARSSTQILRTQF